MSQSGVPSAGGFRHQRNFTSKSLFLISAFPQTTDDLFSNEEILNIARHAKPIEGFEGRIEWKIPHVYVRLRGVE